MTVKYKIFNKFIIIKKNIYLILDFLESKINFFIKHLIKFIDFI